MNNILSYLLQSTLCLSLFWLMFRIVMRKERFFGLTRMLLLTIVVLSAAIPFIHLPLPFQSPIRGEIISAFAPAGKEVELVSPANVTLSTVTSAETIPSPNAANKSAFLTIPRFLFYGYLTGYLIALLFLLRGLISVLLLSRKTKSIPMKGFRLLVVGQEIPAFSFGRWVVLSQSDYEQNRLPLLAHEQAHIRLYHFYDLLLLEVAKIVFWFNPVIYWMAKDLKEIHEFQADDYTLANGIDATVYQLLIIQKGVGPQRFALANSFNHCQMKKRIAMMNQQNPGRVGRWKVVAFLPLLALMLMAFARKAENGTSRGSGLSTIVQVFSKDSIRQWNEADFLSVKVWNSMNENRKNSKWVEPDWSSFKENGKNITIKKSDYSGPCFYIVQVDSKSQLLVGYEKRRLGWSELQDSIRPWLDYESANVQSRYHFNAAMINGKIRMAPSCIFLISRDQYTPLIDHHRLLNTIGNTVLEIRKKNSQNIYNVDYSKLSSEQREQIDILIPLVAMIAQPKNLRPEPKIDKDSLTSSPNQNEDYEFQADSIVSKTDHPITIYLYKNAQVRYKDMKITADYIELNRDSSFILAKGTKDSTGAIIGKPLLTQGKQEGTAMEIRYNFKTKKGIIYDNSKSTEF